MRPVVAVSATANYARILRRRWLLVAILTAIIVGCMLLDFTMGASGLPLGELIQTLFSPNSADPTTRVIVWDIRLPYTLMAMAVGIALGLAGAEMQTILNNPLASPFTLGLSSSAAFGASLVIVLDLAIPGVPVGWTIAGNAFLFAMLIAPGFESSGLDCAVRWSAGIGSQEEAGCAKPWPGWPCSGRPTACLFCSSENSSASISLWKPFWKISRKTW